MPKRGDREIESFDLRGAQMMSVFIVNGVMSFGLFLALSFD